MYTRIYLLLSCSLLLFIAACGNDQAPSNQPTTAPPSSDSSANVQTETSESNDAAYPPPVNTPSANNESAYPAGNEIATDGVRFSIGSEAKPGDTVVNGTAPPNLNLAIVDVTLNGTVLGTGMSDADGNFEIAVSPLEANRRIGIAFASLIEDMTLEEMAEQYLPYRGEQFMSLPNVGLFMDTMMIK